MNGRTLSMAFALTLGIQGMVFAADPYVQANGNQAINSGFFVTPKTKIVVDFAFDNNDPTQQRVFGADDNAQLCCGFYINGSTKYAWAMQDSSGNWTSTDISVTTDRRTFILDSANNRAQLLTDEVTSYDVTISTTRTMNGAMPLMIFAKSTNSAGTTFTNQAKMKLYSLAIYDDGELKRNFVPCKYGSVGALYDTVGKRVYTSITGTDLVIGGDGYTVIPESSTSTWAGGSGSFTDGSKWTNNQAPEDGASVTFDGAGGTVNIPAENMSVNDLTFASTAGAFTLSGYGLTLNGTINNQSSAAQNIAVPLTVSYSLAPAVGGGLSLSSVTAMGSFAPQGNGSAVTLNGENVFSGALVLQNNPLIVSPRVYTYSGWSKDASGNADDNVQVTYLMTSTGTSTFSGLVDYTGGQRGDVIILEGGYVFTGNIQPNGNDGYLVVRGDVTAGSMVWDNNRGWNSRLIIENGGNLVCNGDFSQTGGNGIHTYVDGTFTVNGTMTLSATGCTVSSNGGSDGVLNVNKLVASTLSKGIETPMVNIGNGGMVCTDTQIGPTTLGAMNTSGFTITGTPNFTGATTVKAATPDGNAADIVISGTPSGTAAIAKTGAGKLLIASPAPETYTGTITVSDGTLGYTFDGIVGATVAINEGGALFIPVDTTVTYPALSIAAGGKIIFAATPTGLGTLVAENTAFVPGTTIQINTDTPPLKGTKAVLISGANLADTSAFSLVTSSNMSGTLAVEDGDLVLNVTSSGSTVNDLVWGATISPSDWDLTTDNWLNNGSPAIFASYDNAIFNGTDTAKEINVTENIYAGDVTFQADNATYTLTGEKLLGSNPITIKGGTTLVIDGKGLDAQPLNIENGIVRMGTNVVASGNALGALSAPITIGENGTFDLYVADSEQGHYMNTHNKKFIISGHGFDGQGAICNSGPAPDTKPRVHTIELTADSTIKAQKRWDLRTSTEGINQGRTKLYGPTNVTLTVAGGNEFCAINTDVDLGKVFITDNTTWSIESDSKETLYEGLEIGNGFFRPWNHSLNPITATITASDANSRIGSGSGTVRFEGPINIVGDATLSFSGGATSTYASEISGPGKAEVTGGTQIFANLVTAPFNVKGGYGIFDNNIPGGAGSKSPTVTGSYLAFTPSTSEIYKGYNITTDGGSFMPARTGTATTEVTIEDSTITGTISMGHPGQKGFAKFGNGVTANLSNIYIGDNGSQPQDATLTIASGATVTVASGGEVQLGRWSGDTNNTHTIIVDGGTFDASAANPPRVGYDSRNGLLLVKSGTAKLPGVSTRYHKNHNMAPNHNGIGHEVFGMTGGTVEMGGDITTERGYPYLPQVWLGGGTLKSVADWATDYYQYATFETWGNTSGDGELTIDTNGKKIDYRSALQGNSKVVIEGNGTFNADYNILGGVSGHWTVKSSATLKNAAAFADGITLTEGASATIDIGPRTNYLSAAVVCLASSSPENNQFTQDNFGTSESVFPSLYVKDIQKLITLTSTPTYTGFRHEGEFYVPEAATYTFACTYDDKGWVYVDGAEICANSAWNNMGRGSVELSAGWHTLKIYCKDNGGGAGPTENTGASQDPKGWKAKGMAVGFHKGEISSTSAADYNPITTTAFEMRPVNTVRWTYKAIAGSGDVWTDGSYSFSMVTNTMQALHDTNWAPAKYGANSFSGWMYVEKEDAGEWTFDGVYDDSIIVQLDSNKVFENTSWNSAKTSKAEVSAGWHKFNVMFRDYGGGVSWSGVSNYGAALYVTRPTDAQKVPFDERNIRMTADPYGFIGGTVELGEASTLTNVADGPCEIVGTISGTGCVSGLYRLTGTWDIQVAAANRNVNTIEWKNPYSDTLADAKINVTLDNKAQSTTYYLGCAPMGLEKLSEEELEDRFTCTLDGEAYDGLKLAIKNGQLILTNVKPSGLLIIFQ